MTRRIGDRSGDEPAAGASRAPSVVPSFVPERVLRRRRALRALREGRRDPSPEVETEADG